MSIASGFAYESFNRSRWIRLKYQGAMGLQMEGESQGTTLYIDANVINHSSIYDNFSVDTLFSYHAQLNSNDFLSYQQSAFGLNFNYAFKDWEKTELTAAIRMANRSVGDDTSYQMYDISLGFKYNF